ncbi:hypothetical protein [Chryseobacterium taklimakanense]|uniref:hypothetical protein n=1 Tax=Chryseobacterium taklimakanense TaxID=536441 RepID=UPI0013DE7548|nr:hypothetical protein [Chryseobacterium taklimakanense]
MGKGHALASGIYTFAQAEELKIKNPKLIPKTLEDIDSKKKNKEKTTILIKLNHKMATLKA